MTGEVTRILAAVRGRDRKAVGDIFPLVYDELRSMARRRLGYTDPRRAQVVFCRFFAGMEMQETATALGVSRATVERDWTVARAWLNLEPGRGGKHQATRPGGIFTVESSFQSVKPGLGGLNHEMGLAGGVL